MTEFWETAFTKMQLAWGLEPTASALLACDHFARSPSPSNGSAWTSKKAPMYGQGARLGDDWYERLPNLKMYFYDADSVEREFGPHGLVEMSEIEEQAGSDVPLPFIHVICKKAER